MWSNFSVELLSTSQILCDLRHEHEAAASHGHKPFEPPVGVEESGGARGALLDLLRCAISTVTGVEVVCDFLQERVWGQTEHGTESSGNYGPLAWVNVKGSS